MSKPPLDQKTVDALLAVTKAQMSQEANAKQAQKEAMAPKGFFARRVQRTVDTFNPEALSTSPAARRKAWTAVIVFVLLLVLSWVATKIAGSLKPY
jgi:hypothetical protein